MIEVVGNLWDLVQPGDALVITTNGDVNSEGHAVMGRGIALEAKQRFPGIAQLLGDTLRFQGPTVVVFPGYADYDLVAMPTKYHYRDKADLGLIAQGAMRIRDLAGLPHHNWQRVLSPRPGCGYGGLSWELDVEPLLRPIWLGERFVVSTQ